MAFQAAIERILFHAQAAGAALADPMTDIMIGWPLPRGRCGRIYWAGEAATEHMGGQRTIQSQLVAPRVRATFFWPVPDADEAVAKTIVLEMQALTSDLRARILGDARLGGSLEDAVDMGLADPDVLQLVGGGWMATVDVDWILDYDEYLITV